MPTGHWCFAAAAAAVLGEGKKPCFSFSFSIIISLVSLFATGFIACVALFILFLEGVFFEQKTLRPCVVQTKNKKLFKISSHIEFHST
jgi:hypothetical protein